VKFFDLFEELAAKIETGGKLFLDLAKSGVYGEKQVARLYLYKVKEPSPKIIEQASILYEAIGKVRTIIHALRDMKNAPLILRTSIEINSLENAGDVVLRAAMAHLFENMQDVRELIKWKEIHERIEEAIDVCEDVSNIVEGIVLKNA